MTAGFGSMAIGLIAMTGMIAPVVKTGMIGIVMTTLIVMIVVIATIILVHRHPRARKWANETGYPSRIAKTFPLPPARTFSG